MPGSIAWLMFVGLASVSQLYSVYWLYSRNVPDNVKQTDDNSTYPILCYFALSRSWPNNGTLHPALNATLCTHVIFIGTGIRDNKIALSSPDDGDKYFSKIPLLRKQNPKLKVIVSNGGGGYSGFTSVLASAKNRTAFARNTLPFLQQYGLDGLDTYLANLWFARNSVPFLQQYGLDGLDIDWEFPGWPPHSVAQRANFTMLLQEIRSVFDGEAATNGTTYILSAAVAAGRSVMEVYNVSALAQALDFINLMCYDYHYYRSPDFVTGYNSPLYPTDWWKQLVILSGNVGWSSYEWHKRGMPKSKIMVGIPTYAHTWTLEKPKDYHGLHAPAIGPGRGCSECGYDWVCAMIKSGANVVYDKDAAVPYMYKGDQWVSYDDVNSLTLKTRWIVENGFGGVMVFCLNNDDYHGSCGDGRFPLISAIVDEAQSSVGQIDGTDDKYIRVS